VAHGHYQTFRMRAHRRPRLLCVRTHNHAELASRVMGSMREKAIVIAASAAAAYGDLSDAVFFRLQREERAQVDGGRSVWSFAGKRRTDLGSHNVAGAADRGAEVH